MSRRYISLYFGMPYHDNPTSTETMVQMLVAVTGTDIDNIRQIEEVTNAILQR